MKLDCYVRCPGDYKADIRQVLMIIASAHQRAWINKQVKYKSVSVTLKWKEKRQVQDKRKLSVVFINFFTHRVLKQENDCKGEKKIIKK